MSGHTVAGKTPQTALERLTEKERAEYWASLALRNCKGVGPRTIRRLLNHFGSAYEAVYNVPLWKKAGVSPEKGAPLQEDGWRQAARPEWEDCRDLDARVILWTNPLYPALLRELPDAPALFYARGNLDLLQTPCVGMVGSRLASTAKLETTFRLAKELSESGITVVSGLARGIDRAAHLGALAGIGGSIAVLGSGINVVYPPDNADLYREMEQKGLILSEFPPAARPDSRHFPIRNRIISGISLGVVVVEAALRSGSLVTARLALEQDRSVFAVPPPTEASTSTPNPTTDESSEVPEEPQDGCLMLLEQGALPCFNATDILVDLLPHLENRPAKTRTQRNAPIHISAEGLPLHPSVPARPIPPPPKSPTKAKSSTAPKKKAKKTSTAKNLLPEGSADQIDNVSTASAAAFSPLPPDILPHSPEGRVLETLKQHGALFPDDLAPLAGQEDAGKLGALLVILEVRGLVRRLPGARYEAC